MNIDTKILTTYSDGFRLWRWGFKVDGGWRRGFAIGVHHETGRFSIWSQSKIVFSLLLWFVMIEHRTTFCRIPNKLNRIHGERWELP